MKAVIMRGYGTPEVLELREVAPPKPAANEVLVRVHAASVNDWDCELLTGKSPVVRILNGLFTPKRQILGGDIAGRVEAVGTDVAAFQPGDAVYGDLIGSGLGGFAEYVCAPATCLAHKPPDMTFEQAAAIPQAGMLAVQGLRDVGGIGFGQKVLLNGAGGGVGTFALQIAKQYHVDITAVDKASKLDMLHALGAHHVIDYLEDDFTRRVACYDLILDVKTNRSPRAYARALKPHGVYATVGGNTARLLEAFVLGPVLSRMSKKHLRIVALQPNKDLAYMNELFVAGLMKPVIDRTFRLVDLADAFRRFRTGDHLGKIIVTMA